MIKNIYISLLTTAILVSLLITGCTYTPPPRQEPAKPQRGPVSYIGPELDGTDGVLRGRDYHSRAAGGSGDNNAVVEESDDFEYIFEPIQPRNRIIEPEQEPEDETDSVPTPDRPATEGFSL